MISVHPDRLKMRDAIWSEVSKAAHRGQAVHTGKTAEELIERYPNCGMTLREIEDAILKQITVAGGAVEMEHGTAKRQAGRRWH